MKIKLLVKKKEVLKQYSMHVVRHQRVHLLAQINTEQLDLLNFYGSLWSLFNLVEVTAVGWLNNCLQQCLFSE